MPMANSLPRFTRRKNFVRYLPAILLVAMLLPAGCVKEPPLPPETRKMAAEPAWDDDLWRTLLEDTTFLKLVSLSDPDLRSIEKRLLREEYPDDMEFIEAWNERLLNSTMEGAKCSQTLFARYPDYSTAYIKRIRADDPPPTRAGEIVLTPVVVNVVSWSEVSRFLSHLNTVDRVFKEQVYPHYPEIFECADWNEYVCQSLFYHVGYMGGMYSSLIYSPCNIWKYVPDYHSVLMGGHRAEEFLSDFYGIIYFTRPAVSLYYGEKIRLINGILQMYADYVEYFVIPILMYNPLHFYLYGADSAPFFCTKRTQQQPGPAGGVPQGDPATTDPENPENPPHTETPAAPTKQDLKDLADKLPDSPLKNIIMDAFDNPLFTITEDIIWPGMHINTELNYETGERIIVDFTYNPDRYNRTSEMAHNLSLLHEFCHMYMYNYLGLFIGGSQHHAAMQTDPVLDAAIRALYPGYTETEYRWIKLGSCGDEYNKLPYAERKAVEDFLTKIGVIPNIQKQPKNN